MFATKKRKIIAAILLVLFAAATLAAEDCETRDTPERRRPTATPTVSIADIKAMAISTMEGYPRVRDAAVGQDG